MNFTLFIFFTLLYIGVKNILEMLTGDKKSVPVDNDKITYDVVRGVSLSERKLRLESGYYNKL